MRKLSQYAWRTLFFIAFVCPSVRRKPRRSAKVSGIVFRVVLLSTLYCFTTFSSCKKRSTISLGSTSLSAYSRIVGSIFHKSIHGSSVMLSLENFIFPVSLSICVLPGLKYHSFSAQSSRPFTNCMTSVGSVICACTSAII